MGIKMIAISKTKDGTYCVSNGTVLKVNLSRAEAIAQSTWLYKLDPTKVKVALMAAEFQGHDMVQINSVSFYSSKIDYTNILE